MLRLRGIAVLACAGLLAACGSDQDEYANADIANVDKVKSSFGPQFTVQSVPPAGIDPKLLAPQQMPEGVKFEPPDCGKFAEGQVLPEGLKGNMAATSAEGEGNRFIAIAIETSEPMPLAEPGDACRKVGFVGGPTRGLVEVVEAPQIEGARTVASHRVLQTTVGGAARTGELYNYVASFDNYMVIVTANPLVIPDKPVAPVNTQKARDVLTAAVAAVKG